MKKILFQTIIFLLIFPVLLRGADKKDFEYEFIKTDSSYSFRGRFVVKADFDCLIDVVYKFEHISKYTSGAKSIKLLRQGKNWNNVEYIYRKMLFLENKSTWRRTLKRDEGKVDFKMISNKNNIAILPDLVSSSGYYQIKPENECFRVEYFQKCVLKPGLLKNTYINQAKKEAIRFLGLFKKHVEITCD